jgi:riboflavin kinase / FMN adenylyltransferase
MADINIKTILTDKWFKGKKIKGRGRGKKLGFPTINLKTNNKKLKKGVYCCKIRIKGKIYKGILFYGERLTFSEEKPVWEVYIFNFNKKIKLGSKLFFNPKKFIRPVKKFNSKMKLAREIQKDVTKCKFFL